MTNVVTPIETDQRVSWADRLNAMDVSQKLPASFKGAQSARQAIWKIQNTCDRRFTTKKVSENLIIITREV